MTSCAATTTIREALKWAQDDFEAADAEAALVLLEQLVEAAQVIARKRLVVSRADLDTFAAAVAAVGPGEEAAQ